MMGLEGRFEVTRDAVSVMDRYKTLGQRED